MRADVQAVAVRSHLGRRQVTLCSVYLAPGCVFPTLELRRLVAELPAPFLLLGDFNAHHTNWGCDNTDTRGRLLESLLNDESLCLLNTGAKTHFTLPSGQTSALDLSICSPQMMQYLTWSVDDDPCGSDHLPVWLHYKDGAVLGSRPPRWLLRRADWGQFEEEVELAVRWRQPEERPMSVDEFTEMIVQSAGQSIPKTSGAPRRPPVPWWTKACRDAIRTRRRAYRAFDRCSTLDNLIAFRQARASARRVILEAKRRSWREYVGGLNRSTRTSEVWDRIKRIGGRHCSKPLPVLRVHGHDVFHPADVANEIGRALAERCRGGGADPEFVRHKTRCERSPVNFYTSEQHSYNEVFTMAELRSAISSLRSVSEGPDEVHNDMLRHLPHCAVETLLTMFNAIWTRGEFPLAWREAIVIPLCKPGKSGLNPLDYRPISLTSSLCKLLEKMVNLRLTWFLEKNNVFDNAQCGLRKNRSTVDHLLALDTAVRVAFRERRHVGGVFFDIEGAYDTTWRHGILLKAFGQGIRGRMGVFLQNYLDDRFFRVRVGKHFSDRFLQVNGVPQGGVLSVTLFAIMINDVVDRLPRSVGRSLFVDDLAIWCKASSAISMERQLQLAVGRLEKWSLANGFRFSTSKTVACHFCRSRRGCPALSVQLYGKLIPSEPVVRFLGLQFDKRLTYRDHFKSLREKCFKSLNVLKCVAGTSYGADRVTLLRLYRSLIRSKLDYACFVYDSACDSSKRTLDTVHNSALRIATALVSWWKLMSHPWLCDGRCSGCGMHAS